MIAAPSAKLYASTPGTLHQAVWVFPLTTPSPSNPTPSGNPISDPVARQALVANSKASGADMLYVSVYDGNYDTHMYPATDIASLITTAHSNDMKVYAAYGDVDWPGLGCDGAAWPMLRMQDVVAYNAANPSARFDGVMLDVEPPDPQSAADFQALLGLYQCLGDCVRGNGMTLSVAIKFYWGDDPDNPAGDNVLFNGQVKKAYQHIIDMALEHVVVMGYRDSAGTACPSNGIICLDQDEIAYADSVGKSDLVLVGLETKKLGVGTDAVTFFQEGQAALDSEAGSVASYFADGFGGFAVHNYADSYLGGQSSNWPTVNPSFPSTASALPGAPSNLMATAVSSSQINLAWTDNSANETGFKVEWSTDGNTFTQIAAPPAGTTSYSVTNLSPATTYWFRVLAYNGAGDSASSNVASATTLQAPPAAPSNLTATAVSSTEIDLAWTDNSANETGFKIERSTNGTSFTQIATVSANVGSYSNAGLTKNKTYYYRVRAYNAAGNSAYSNTASATTPPR
jgi:hypothetical protein